LNLLANPKAIYFIKKVKIELELTGKNQKKANRYFTENVMFRIIGGVKDTQKPRF